MNKGKYKIELNRSFFSSHSIRSNMNTTIANCKVCNIRPKYGNLKEWMSDVNNVYIGRSGVVFIEGCRYPPKASLFANPFKIGKDGDRNEVLEKYKLFIHDKLRANAYLREELMKLKGKTLGCWCFPEKCHGDVLIELLASDDFR